MENIQTVCVCVWLLTENKKMIKPHPKSVTKWQSTNLAQTQKRRKEAITKVSYFVEISFWYNGSGKKTSTNITFSMLNVECSAL